MTNFSNTSEQLYLDFILLFFSFSCCNNCKGEDFVNDDEYEDYTTSIESSTTVFNLSGMINRFSVY